jgi:hypothetical protein
MPLSSVDLKKRRALISKLKEETVSKEETLELVSLLEKERRIAFEEGGDCMLVFAILSLISYINEYSESHSELSKKNNS